MRQVVFGPKSIDLGEYEWLVFNIGVFHQLMRVARQFASQLLVGRILFRQKGHICLERINAALQFFAGRFHEEYKSTERNPSLPLHTSTLRQRSVMKADGDQRRLERSLKLASILAQGGGLTGL